MSSFERSATPLSGLTVVERLRREDTRGYFSRFFCANELSQLGFHLPISQINHTLTVNRGVVRGLHFQYPPHAEDKFVSCLRGEIYDVAVDLRRDSPTFLQWYGQVLSADNRKSLLIPQGFAHGFQTLSANCELLYLHSRAYAPEAEGGIRAIDPALGIEWPLAISEMSDRDRIHPLLDDQFLGI